MWKNILITLLNLGCIEGLCAQNRLDSLKKKYEADGRDQKVVREYAEALREIKEVKASEKVIREYMMHCPVIQVGDKDTYLLVNRYVFEDPYSNVFEYGIYAIKKMKWDRVPKNMEEKQERLRNMFKGWGSGVSGDDEIDKRYEVLMVLSKNLSKEIDRQCSPEHQDGKYCMPVWDSVKIQRLEYLLNKGELLGQDGMRLKLAVRKALQKNHFLEVLQNLCVAVRLKITGAEGEYIVAIMNVLTDCSLQKEEAEKALQLVLQLYKQEERDEGGVNYCNILGRLYRLCGDAENGEKYTRMGDAIEAEKMARFQEMMKSFNNK